MKLTLKDKLLYLSQYLGQQVVIKKGSEDEPGFLTSVDLETGIVSYRKAQDTHNSYLNFSDCCLLLRSLKSITDTEAIQSCKEGYSLAFLGNNSVGKWKCIHSEKNFISISTKYSEFSFEFDKEGCPLIDMYREKELYNSFSNEFAYQYLISKSFALDYRGTQVREFVASEWIKLAEL